MESEAKNIGEEPTNGVKEITFNNWRDFVQWLTQDPDGKDYYWRGVKDAKYHLVPSIYRKENGNLEKYGLNEAKTLRYFCSLAKSRVQICSSWEEPQDATDLGLEATFKWWCLAQHLEIPTPLLDWTCYAFVALFFSIEDIHKDKKFPHIVSVYGIKKAMANSQNEIDVLCDIGIINPIYKYIHFISGTDHIEKRIFAQCGVFSFINKYTENIDECHKDKYYDIKKVIKIHSDPDEKILTQCNIHFRDKQDALECRFFLAHAGITKANLYPDMIGIKHDIAFRIENDFYVGSTSGFSFTEFESKFNFSVNRKLAEALSYDSLSAISKKAYTVTPEKCTSNKP